MMLGAVDGFVMTNAFVALAESVSRGERGDTLVICHPSAPFANAGFHQEVEREIDMNYCREHGIPVVRRVIGGGAIADGPWEQDYFFISSLRSEATRGTLRDYYGRMLEPVSRVLHGLGIRAERQGLNDLAVDGRKISANGAVDIEDARVLTGDILLDLNIGMMTGILRVPDEKFRGKVADTMAQYLTSVREQKGQEVPRTAVERMLIHEFSIPYGGEHSQSEFTELERERLEELVAERKTDAWLFEPSTAHSRLDSIVRDAEASRRVVKIREGMFVCRHDLKAQKLIRVTMLVNDDTIADVSISGDFFTVPVGWSIRRLEDALKGSRLEEEEVLSAVRKLIAADGVTVLGATAEDFAHAVIEAAEHPLVTAGR